MSKWEISTALKEDQGCHVKSCVNQTWSTTWMLWAQKESYVQLPQYLIQFLGRLIINVVCLLHSWSAITFCLMIKFRQTCYNVAGRLFVAEGHWSKALYCTYINFFHLLSCSALTLMIPANSSKYYLKATIMGWLLDIINVVSTFTKNEFCLQKSFAHSCRNLLLEVLWWWKKATGVFVLSKFIQTR